jgi:hypothetical protein
MNAAPPIGADDLGASGPLRSAGPASPRALWPWLLLGLTVLLVLLAAGATVELVQWLRQAHDGWELVIDGERIVRHDLGAGQVLLVLGGVLLAALIVLLVVPLAVGVGLLGAALGVGVALLALLAVAALALSPLWLPVLLLWLVLRRTRATRG